MEYVNLRVKDQRVSVTIYYGDERPNIMGREMLLSTAVAWQKTGDYARFMIQLQGMQELYPQA